MYNLKKILGIISFEPKNIKILLVDCAKAAKYNCLYYKSLPYQGYDNSFKINLDLTKKLLNGELIKVDKFLGIKVKRYIINIPNLELIFKKGMIDNHNFKNEDSIKEYLNNNVEDASNICIKSNIEGYVLNGIKLNSFPTNEPTFKAIYKSYFISKEIINQYENLFNELNIELMGVYNNALCWSNLFEKTNKNKLLIDINELNIDLIEYDKNNEIINFKLIPFGTNWLRDLIKTKLEINNDLIIDNMIDAFKSTQTIDSNPIIANYYKDKFLDITQLDLNSLKSLIVKWVSNQLEKVNNEIIGNEYEYEQISLNCNNQYLSLYEFVADQEYLKINNQPLIIFQKKLIGIEEDDISNLIWIVDNILKTTSNNEYVSSIDPFISEEMINRQFRQNILLKFGIISTNISAKLGGQGN